MLIDTHCHLAAAIEFAADRDALVAAARLAGVSSIVVPAVDLTSFAEVHGCCHALCRMRAPAYGIHPLYVQHAGNDDLAILRNWLARAF
jgi:TatD DNase family protein